MIISIPFSDLSNFMFPVYQKKDEVLVKISQRCSGSSFHWVSDQLVFKKTTIKSLKVKCDDNNRKYLLTRAQTVTMSFI